MSDIEYVHVRWFNGAEQMVPVGRVASAEPGELEVVDPTPGPYRPVEDIRAEKALATEPAPESPAVEPEAPSTPATPVATEPAPKRAPKAEEATK